MIRRFTILPFLAAIFIVACNGQGAGADRPAGETRVDERGIEQVWVPAGSFDIGADPAELEQFRAGLRPGIMTSLLLAAPRHSVRLSRGYWIDHCEVTNEAFAGFVAAGGYGEEAHWSEQGRAWLARQNVALLETRRSDRAPDLPVVEVTWFEAEAYAAWRGGRLPSEAEWEYAARGPDSRLYPWGDEFDAALCNLTGSTALTPAGSFPGGASWVGALDMTGNAMEWTADWLSTAYYAASPAVDPRGPETGTIKVERGGWYGAPVYTARASYRHYEDTPEYADGHIGFRIVSED